MSINTLPNEVLAECFAYLSTSKRDIKNLRLTSNRFHAISSHFLVTYVKVSLFPRSFERLECLSRHPVFSKSVQSVTLHVCYYVGTLAASFSYFAYHAWMELYRHRDWMSENIEAEWGRLAHVHEILDDWNDARRRSFEELSANENQKIVYDAHKEYIRLYNDQKKLLGDEGLVKRLMTTFQSFPAMKSIVIDDQHLKPAVQHGPLNFSDRISTEALRELCLAPSRWGEQHATQEFIWISFSDRPIPMVFDLFKSLAESDIRLQLFEIKIAALYEFPDLHMSDERVNAMATALSKTREAYLSVQNWEATRDYTLGARRQRTPFRDLAPLGIFSSALFRSPLLTNIHISLGDFTNLPYRTISDISLGALLPSPLPFQCLKKIYLQDVPFTISQMQDLTRHVQCSLNEIFAYRCYLLEGRWRDVLDLLRTLDVLASLELLYMEGGEFFDYGGQRRKPRLEDNAIEDYVLKKSDKNPLARWRDEDENTDS